MPERFTPSKELAFAKALIEYLQAGARAMGTTDNLDIYARHMLINLHVFIGEAEKRPYTAADLANAIGMSRSTVQRELARMVDHGILQIKKQGRRKVVCIRKEAIARMRRPYLKAARRFFDRIEAINS